MATTRLSDAIIPQVYESYGALNNISTSKLYQAGVIANSDLMNRKARDGGIEGQFPYWKDLDWSVEPNMSNDDPADVAIPNKIGTGKMNYRKVFLNQGWSAMDLVAELAGQDPMRRIRERTDAYWNRQYERRAFATLKGIIADNIANDGADMGINQPTAVIDDDMITDANYTMGDNTRVLGIVLMHSAVMKRLSKLQKITSVPSADGKIVLQYYANYLCVMDDDLIWSGTAPTGVFLTVFVGRGVFGFGGVGGNLFAEGEGIPKVPTEIQRKPDVGNGGGEEILWERKTVIMQPRGFSWIEAPASGGADLLTEMSPTLSDLQRAAHWDRVTPRKNIPMAYILSKAQ